MFCCQFTYQFFQHCVIIFYQCKKKKYKIKWDETEKFSKHFFIYLIVFWGGKNMESF